MPIIGSRMATATPETRGVLIGIAETLSKVGKYAMIALIVTGLLVLWLKWNWVPPNAVWFWIKMAAIVAMIFCIVQNERNSKLARAGDRDAAKRSQMFGQLTGAAFIIVILSAVFAFS